MRLFLSNNIYFLTNSDKYSKIIVQSLQFLLLKQDSFFLVGGTAEPEDDPESFHRDILRYDPDSEQWVEIDQKLQKPDFVRVALFSSEISVPCFAEGEGQ